MKIRYTAGASITASLEEVLREYERLLEKLKRGEFQEIHLIRKEYK